MVAIITLFSNIIDNMSNILRMRELTETDDSGIWVGLGQYETELPHEKDVRFVVRRTKGGLWRAAVRGYSQGEQFKAIRDRDGRLAAEVNDRIHPVFEVHHEVHPVNAEDGERYIESARNGNWLAGAVT